MYIRHYQPVPSCLTRMCKSETWFVLSEAPRPRRSPLDATGRTTLSLQSVDIREASDDLESGRGTQAEDGEMHVASAEGTNDRLTDGELAMNAAGDKSTSANLPCIGSDASETPTIGSPQGGEMDDTACYPLDFDTATASPHTDSTSCQTLIPDATTATLLETNPSGRQPLDSDTMSSAPHKADNTSCQDLIPDSMPAAPHETNTSSGSPMDTDKMDAVAPHTTDTLKADETADVSVGFKLPVCMSSKNACTTDRGKYSSP